MSPIRAKTAALAAHQHGRISVAQLLEAGADRQRIKRWCRDGTLHRKHRGVHAFGHAAPSLLGELMAAVLAAGEGAVVSHRSAAHLLGLIRGRPPAQPEVTAPTLASRRRPGITIHRVAQLPASDVTRWERIPVTNVPRTLLDLAPLLPPPDLARACHEAWVRHRTRPQHVEACIARNPHRKGIGRLRSALGTDVTLSVLEDGFVALLARHGLPLPRAFENDVARRRRSRHHAFTYGDVVERAEATVTEVRRLLTAPARSGGGA